jgi:hypothetical protein
MPKFIFMALSILSICKLYFEPKKRNEQAVGGVLWTSQRAEQHRAFLHVIIKIPPSLPIEDPCQLPEETVLIQI